MEEKKPYAKTYKYGNTTVIVHSDLLKLTDEERYEYFEEQKRLNNSVIMEIVRAINNCYRKYD
ncbi:hypothetical protein [Peribacillus glennii]|uniref:Uncharacterized protein n=1 Tax=Peribacillus glennii TaxID=2303991 RepID=A0A372L714_9BACI|nr:hypothetical protein [Peribacillus glennii]RFU60970.1 hypothetical protein D0466_19775 [Peribacillus glennii]